MTRLLSPISVFLRNFEKFENAASIEAGADVFGGAMPLRVPQLPARGDDSHISSQAFRRKVCHHTPGKEKLYFLQTQI